MSDLSQRWRAGIASGRTQSVNLSLSGMGSVTVYGKPQHRNVSVDGLGKVKRRRS